MCTISGNTGSDKYSGSSKLYVNVYRVYDRNLISSVM